MYQNPSLSAKWSLSFYLRNFFRQQFHSYAAFATLIAMLDTTGERIIPYYLVLSSGKRTSGLVDTPTGIMGPLIGFSPWGNPLSQVVTRVWQIGTITLSTLRLPLILVCSYPF